MKQLKLALLIGSMYLIAGCPEKDKAPPPNLFNKLSLGTPGETTATGEFSKSDRTHVLEEEDSMVFVDDYGKVEIHHSKVSAMKVGDLVVGNAESKMLVELREIESSGDGKTVARAKLAGIPELTQDTEGGEFTFETTPIFKTSDGLEDSGVSQLVTSKTAQRGNRGNTRKKRDRLKRQKKNPPYTIDKDGRIVIKNQELFSFQLGENGQIEANTEKILGVENPGALTGFQTEISGKGSYKGVINYAEIEVIPTFRGNHKWKRGRPVKIDSSVDALVKLKMDVSYESSGSITGSLIFDLLKTRTVPIRIPGAVPVYIDVDFSMPLVLDLDVQLTGTNRIVYEAEYAFQGGMTYTKKDGLKTTNANDQKVLHKELTTNKTEGKFTADLSLQPTIEARFYRVVGPYVYLQPYIKSTVVRPQVQKTKDLFVGVGGGIGVQLSEPIMLTDVINYDSGRIFDWNIGWDLDGEGSDANSTYAFPELNGGGGVSSLTDEGFVAFHLKQNDSNLRYALVEAPKHGTAVPSKTLFYDGEIYYYPMGTSTEDSFKVAVIGPDGSSVIKEIPLVLSQAVLDEAGKPRFGRATKKVSVALDGPAEHKEKVPQISVLSGNGVAVVEIPMGKKLVNNKVTCEGMRYFFDQFMLFQGDYDGEVDPREEEKRHEEEGGKGQQVSGMNFYEILEGSSEEQCQYASQKFMNEIGHSKIYRDPVLEASLFNKEKKQASIERTENMISISDIDRNNKSVTIVKVLSASEIDIVSKNKGRRINSPYKFNWEDEFQCPMVTKVFFTMSPENRMAYLDFEPDARICSLSKIVDLEIEVVDDENRPIHQYANPYTDEKHFIKLPMESVPIEKPIRVRYRYQGKESPLSMPWIEMNFYLDGETDSVFKSEDLVKTGNEDVSLH